MPAAGRLALGVVNLDEFLLPVDIAPFQTLQTTAPRTNVSLMFSPHLLETPHAIVREVDVSGV